MLKKRDVSCDGVTYSDTRLERCRSTLCLYDDRQGPGGYPHHYRNREKLNFGSFMGQLYGYPLVGGNRAYNGVSEVSTYIA